MNVPLLDLKPQYSEIKDEVNKELQQLFESQRFILGEPVEKLEAEIAKYSGCKYACGVSSGSDALIISLMVAGVGHGDEVITSPFTFFATAGAIARVGATPVFVDIEPRVFNINANLIEEKITNKTKAIIPVHLFGQCANMGKITEIAEKYNLVVIEDAAQAIGAEFENKRAGSMGDFGCFSFFPSKNLGCFGDGGMVVTNNEKYAELLKIFRNHGAKPKYYHKYIGGNFRLDALQAVILSIKLKYLDEWTLKRQKNAAEYRNMFAEAKLTDKVLMPLKADYRTRHIYNQFSILISDNRRNELKDKLKAAGIGSEIYYPVPLHLQECFSDLGYKKGDLPVSEEAAQQILSLPIYPESTTDQRKYVVDTIKQILL